jgi:hypothetical protein
VSVRHRDEGGFLEVCAGKGGCSELLQSNDKLQCKIAALKEYCHRQWPSVDGALAVKS